MIYPMYFTCLQACFHLKLREVQYSQEVTAFDSINEQLANQSRNRFWVVSSSKQIVSLLVLVNLRPVMPFTMYITYSSFAALRIHFVNDTPIVGVDSVHAEIEINRPGVQISCHLTHLRNSRKDCKFCLFQKPFKN